MRVTAAPGSRYAPGSRDYFLGTRVGYGSMTEMAGVITAVNYSPDGTSVEFVVDVPDDLWAAAKAAQDEAVAAEFAAQERRLDDFRRDPAGAARRVREDYAARGIPAELAGERIAEYQAQAQAA